MSFDNGTAFAVIAAGISVVVWLVRLEGRVNLTDARYVDLKVDLHEIKDDLKSLMARKNLGLRETDGRP
jgi:hypothetical protein